MTAIEICLYFCYNYLNTPEGGVGMIKRIGIIMGKVYKKTNSRQLSGILKQAYSLGISAYVFALNEEYFDENVNNGEKNLLSLINFSLLDGMIYLPYSFSQEDIKQSVCELLKYKCPLPVICLSKDDTGFENIWFDDDAHIEEVTSHLISVHGCRKIMCLTGPESMQVAQHRLAGFRRAVRKHGLEDSDENIVYGDFWINSAVSLGEDIAEGRCPVPDAVVCTNDSMAIALCNCLAAHGISVPADLRVTGYDGAAEAYMHSPSITTYSASWEKLGAEAMCRLYELITGPPAGLCDVDGGGLVCGESCGCGHAEFNRTDTESDFEKMEAGYMDSSISTRLLSAKSLNTFLHELYCLTYAFATPEYYDNYDFCLCLCDDWDKLSMDRYSRTYRTSGYSDKMLMTNIDLADVQFETEGMVPPWYNEGGPSVIFFTASHFRDRCFGYFLLRLRGAAVGYSIYYQRFCLEVNNALAFLSLQNDFRSVAYRNYISRSRDELTGLYLLGNAPQMWEETAELARLYGEDIYMICLSVGGLKQLAETEGSVERDKVVLLFADILKSCCASREKVFRAGEADFAVIGSELSPCARPAELIKKINALFKEQNMLLGNPHFMFIRSCTKTIPVTALCGAEEAEKIILGMLKSPAEQLQPSHMEQMHYSELIALRRDIFECPELNWNLDECCRRLSISRSHFQKLYKRTFDVNCQQDIKQSKLNYAKKLLVGTNDTLQDIAEKCGYDYSHFMRLFNKEVGMTPTQYRRGKDKMQ